MQFPEGTTVIVSDGAQLRVFTNTGNELHLALTEHARPEIHGHNSGSGKRHHSSSGNPDDSRQSEDGYSAAVVDWLNAQVLAGHIRQLYVVAPPRALGEMRRHYHPALQRCLLGELGKEHTHDTPQALHEALLHA